ncbi:MAG: hypothetical protein LBM70_00620 [Victivallales bacterium]|jgi:hypothetical protein|nr:hypothetical protein [Victivallales bacterium]
MKKAVCLCISLFCAVLLSGANLLLDAQGNLRGGKPNKGITIKVHDELVDITIEGASRQWNSVLPIAPDTKFVRVRMKMKVTDVERGKEAWQDARLAILFRNSEKKGVGNWPATFHATGTTQWVDCDRLYPVPEGAVDCVLGPANFGTSGTVQFFNLLVEELQKIENMDLDVPPPDGSSPKSAGSLKGAWNETTPTRERVSLNGLWEFRPLLRDENPDVLPPPGSGWGYFKVPGAWPTHNNGMRFYLSALFMPKFRPQDLNSAWYRRTFDVPESWQGKRIVLSADMIQSCAKVSIDGKEAGELYYPGGELDLTGKLLPGKEQTLTMFVSAKPEKSSIFMAPGRLISQDSALTNRGITGDLYLDASPLNKAIADVHVITSLKKKKSALTPASFTSLPENIVWKQRYPRQERS